MSLKIFIAALATITLPALASAQTVGIAEYQYYELNIPVTLSPTSGLTSGTQEFLRSNILRRSGFINRISVDERSDAPCQIDIEFNGANNEALRFSECGSRGEVEGTTVTHVARVPEGVMVNSVRICLNGAGNKIKGMRIDGNFAPCLFDSEATYAVAPKPDKVVRSKVGGGHVGVVPRDGHYLAKCSPAWFDEWSRPNCDDWQQTRSCPSGAVAYGVAIRYAQGNGGRRRIHGVRLACAPVSLKD